MNNHLKGFIAAAAVAFASTSAIAADLAGPSFSSILPSAVQSLKPGFVWTGVYVGGNVGLSYGERQGQFGSDTVVSELGGWVRPKDDFQTFIGGAQAGYNWQTGLLVFGVEGDISYLDDVKALTMPRTVEGPTYTANGTVTVLNSLEWLGTVRGRLGVAADRFFVYGTGGLAFGDVKNSATVEGTVTTGGVVTPLEPISGNGDETRTGWTVGAGTEYAITNNLTGKFEYLYYNLGTSKYDVGAPGEVADYHVRSDNTGNVVRAGLNFKW
jgi:outer membrane immunogenic protein